MPNGILVFIEHVDGSLTALPSKQYARHNCWVSKPGRRLRQSSLGTVPMRLLLTSPRKNSIAFMWLRASGSAATPPTATVPH
jgi:hypothetical protein